ncbi:MAG: M1 family aminopeptidase [Flavobacteriaceae bacterium]
MRIIKITFFIIFLSFQGLSAQNLYPYHGEADKEFALIHTKLKLEPNYENQTLEGEAWIQLKPYAQAQNRLKLDAKYMLIHQVKIDGRALDYSYKQNVLNIELGRNYGRGQQVEVYISYTARPEKALSVSSAANKGLYFINPKGLNNNKPTQIWTNGIPGANSIWFPTLDHPNQKMTQEITLVYPSEFSSVSNGILKSSKKTKEGKKEDTWKLDKSHSPYLAFFSIGPYEKVSDKKGQMEVNYYVAPDYVDKAKEVFGDSPEMISFFEQKLGVAFPWPIYNQVVVSDFNFGAMENTTAVSHDSEAYQSSGQLADENLWETTVAHEIFHQWFGDLVSPESWANIALSESFATYSEYLWLEHKYGVDRANLRLKEFEKGYFDSGLSNEPLARYHYPEAIDVFDKVSYDKGAYILHMLRKQIGDVAFFEGLNLYLTTYAHQSAEIPELRQVYEKVLGRDMNWFFDQWVYKSGHPRVQVDLDYNSLEKTVSVSFKQLGTVYTMPMRFSIYENGAMKQVNIWLNERENSFLVPYQRIPDLIEVNDDQGVLAEINQNKTQPQLIFQALNSASISNRIEALNQLKDLQGDQDVFKVFAKSIESKHDPVAVFALENINLAYKYGKRSTINYVVSISENTAASNKVRAAAIELLGKLVNPEYGPIFEKGLQTNSNAILSKSLTAMYYINQDLAFKTAADLPDDVKQGIAYPLVSMYINEKDSSEMSFVASYLVDGMYLIRDKEMKTTYEKGFDWVIKSNNPEAIKNLCTSILEKSTTYASYGFKDVGIDLLRQIINEQYKGNYSNKDEIVQIVSAALDEIISSN